MRFAMVDDRTARGHGAKQEIAKAVKAARATRYHADLTLMNSRNGSQDGKRRADRSGTQAREATRCGNLDFA
jgi:hypothetical protein